MTIRLRPGALYDVQKKFNLSRDGLARRMGVASTTAFRVERGDTVPSAAFVAGLLTVTGMPFEALFVIEAAPGSQAKAS